MTNPSVICQAVVTLIATFLAIALILVVRNNNRQILMLKKRHWNAFMTERRKNYDSGWNNGYEFRKNLENAILTAALEYTDEREFDMQGKDRIAMLVAQMIQKIEGRYEIFNTTMESATGETSSLANKVSFYTTMIQIIRDNPSQSPETAEVERHVVQHLIKLRNVATKDMIEHFEMLEASK